MIHSNKEFAAICGLKTKDLSNYIKRGKVVSINKKIDDQLPENAEFLEKYQAKAGAVHIDVKEKKFTKAEQSKAQEYINKQEAKAKRVEEYSVLNQKKRQLETEQLTESIQLLKLKKEKQEGYLIPTSLVRDLFTQHFRSVTISFQQGAENLIVEISKKKSLVGRKRQS